MEDKIWILANGLGVREQGKAAAGVDFGWPTIFQGGGRHTQSLECAPVACSLHVDRSFSSPLAHITSARCPLHICLSYVLFSEEVDEVIRYKYVFPFQEVVAFL